MTCMTMNSNYIYTYSYDPNYDILRLSLKKTSNFYYEEIDDNIYSRIDDDTDEIVGYQIIDFSKIDFNRLSTIIEEKDISIFKKIYQNEKL